LIQGGPEAWDIFVLAVVQGLTEFLPVSSSGHLVLFGSYLEVEQMGLGIGVGLHLGTLMAVLAHYRRDLGGMAFGALRGERGSWREIGLLGLATVPAALVALFLRDALDELFREPVWTAWALLVTAGWLLLGARAHRRAGADPKAAGSEEAGSIGVGRALGMGLAQAVAIVPGISRSGSTIATGMMMGGGSRPASRFSFLMSVPAIAGAGLLDAFDGDLFAGLGPGLFALGLFTAAIVGWGALRATLWSVERGKLGWFALYCLAAGGLNLLLF